MKCVFLTDYTVKDTARTEFKKGQEVTFDDESSAKHFLLRGVAALADDELGLKELESEDSKATKATKGKKSK